MVTPVPSGFHFNKSITSSVKLQFVGVSRSHISYVKMSPVRMKNTMLRGNKLGIAAVLLIAVYFYGSGLSKATIL